MMYYQIIRADGSSKNYKIFNEMLDDFDRQNVMDLHILVQERYDTTSPEGYDLLLWGNLKILFEPNEENEIWRKSQSGDEQTSMMKRRRNILLSRNGFIKDVKLEVRRLIKKVENGI
ncbi:hypothetical protein Tco_0175577 [Tanacetum coccineum]